MILEVITPKL